MKRPPDHEAGLALLLRLKGAFSWYLLSLVPDIGAERDSESEPDLVEDAVKYIIFLVDADRLFDTALGMYDFSLVLMVAQHAQKVRLSLAVPDVATHIVIGPAGVPTFPAGVARFGSLLPTL